MKILTHTVKPRLEGELAALDAIARNLWLSWNFDAVSLFIRIDPDAWMASGQNPVKMLGMVSQERFDQLVQDDSFIASVNDVKTRFERYKKGEAWYKGPKKPVTAYFSMEFGIDVSLPTYSGGLGILSGDHMKTSSDLGLPLVGVGLLYRQGYFKQYLNADGFQQESYPENDWYNMPVEQCADPDGKPILISVDLAGRLVHAAVWEVKVGRSSLFLLDTNIPENAPEDRTITATLYGGDKETRIRQEIVLGIGGIRALAALGVEVAATHMNEGHSAFLALERIKAFMAEGGLSAREAIQAFIPTNIFTTHTPVPAGNERFGIDLMEKYFRGLIESYGLQWGDFLALGRENPQDYGESFCMTVFALKLSARANGVSELHGAVSRDMWKNLWPQLTLDEVPIGHVTNGVHPRTWISHDMLPLLDRYLGPRFQDEPGSRDIWDRMDRVSDEELWRTHERRRERLVAFCGDRLDAMLVRLGVTGAAFQKMEAALSPSVFTLSFARRFATYKRGNLLLSNPDRLIKLLSSKDMPMQVIFAGKAHPHDIPGKEIIRELVHFSRKDEVLGRVVFLEDYDMTMSRYMTSGSDVWLNTPRRPLEASGTSGMKAGMNGVLNCSVLDGWWAEGYKPELGWAIGLGEEYKDDTLQDKVESDALYDLLEREILPTFYRRGRDNLPREWIAKMRESMKSIGRDFSSHRMLEEYYEDYYRPAMAAGAALKAEGYASSKSLSAYLDRAASLWPQVAVLDVTDDAPPVVLRGTKINVTATVALAGLAPEEVRVECFRGPLTSKGEIRSPERIEMEPLAAEPGPGAGAWKFAAVANGTLTGQIGYSIRVLPKHPALGDRFVPGLVRWA
jgi:starch phosphorylase